MTEQSQTEGAEEDFQRWKREALEFEMGMRDEPPRIYAKDSTSEERASKITSIANWLRNAIK